MKRKKVKALLFTGMLAVSALLAGCSKDKDMDGKTVIELVQYKPEAVEIFENLAQEFNSTHEDIYLKVESPNDAMTILKTRFIREDYPDIIGIGGDINYSYFVDSEILADISNYEGLKKIKQAYIDILEGLEFVPIDGIYGVPYVANAAGVLYNRQMFQEHGWQIPKTWDELMQLCEQIKNAGIQPFYFGFKDTWTCLAPWNALAVDLAPSDVCKQVNRGDTTFKKEYSQIPDKMLSLLQYGQNSPFAYGYNDACIAFARGEAAMFTIGSYAVPQIKSGNPELDIDSFVMPGSNQAEENVLNSGVDLQFCITKECKNKEAAYKVLDFLLSHDMVQMYLDEQMAVPCVNEQFQLASILDGMKEYIEEGRMYDYQDHYYPSEMAVDAQIQTFLIEKDVDKFLEKFDRDWLRYNRDIIQKVKDYEKNQEK